MRDHVNALRSQQERVATLKQVSDSGFVYQNQLLTWMDIVQRTSMMFGRVYTTLEETENLIKEDVVFYADTIFTIQWLSLIENATVVLSILGVPVDSIESQV